MSVFVYRHYQVLQMIGLYQYAKQLLLYEHNVCRDLGEIKAFISRTGFLQEWLSFAATIMLVVLLWCNKLFYSQTLKKLEKKLRNRWLFNRREYLVLAVGLTIGDVLPLLGMFIVLWRSRVSGAYLSHFI